MKPDAPVTNQGAQVEDDDALVLQPSGTSPAAIR
jgi:hypothetical protein